MSRTTTLPVDSDARKEIPMLRGCLSYFPAALAGVAAVSKVGNDKHNPGQEMHHARGKSADHGDCIIRHLMDVQDYLAIQKSEASLGNPVDRSILWEVNQLAWRALALSQELHERFGGAPLAPGAKLSTTVDIGKSQLPLTPVPDNRRFNAPNTVATRMKNYHDGTA